MEGLNKHVQTLVAVFVSSSGEKVKGVLQIEIVVSVKMTSYKVVNAILGHGVQILELVHCRELDDVESVGQHTIYFSIIEDCEIKACVR